MTDRNTGGYAFPHIMEHLHEPVTAGMTLRDYFAARAIAICPRYAQEDMAIWCYRMADAMLKARDQ